MRKVCFILFLLAAQHAVAQSWQPSGSNLYFSTGNVGIGTNSPQTKLDVEGTLSVLSGSHKLYFMELGAFDPLRAGIRNNAGSMVLNAKDGSILYLNRDVNASTRIQATSGSVTKNIAVFNTNGNVSIGNDDPATLLHVGAKQGEAGTSYGTTLLQVFQPFNTTTPSASIDIGMCQPHARITGYGSTSHNGYGQLAFSTMDLGVVKEAMRITDRGNVGIGTTNPGDYKLAVEGRIGAREVKVTIASWADYVFNKDYQLMSLANLEAFIKKNNHLPNIPSAQEVKDNEGIELGEMNRRLLEKIEELTLHVIELNKEVQQLKKDNAASKR